MSLTQAELNEIKERAEKATPGPWVKTFATGIEIVCDFETKIISDDSGVIRYSDAEFIAHAREDIPSLLDHIAELEAVINVIREVAAEGYATACTSDEARAYGSIIDVLNRKKGVKE